MGFGRHLRELSRLRLGLLVSLLIGLLAAVWSVNEISLLPPKLTPRSLELATAFTQVVVDTPDSAILDLRQGTDDIQALKNRALLVGNVMGSPPVRMYIAKRAQLPVGALQVVTPRTPQAPRPRAEVGQKKGPGDLLKSTDQYRLDIQANPTVPVLDVYAQAPTAASAKQLANAAVDGLGDYLDELATKDKTPRASQVRLTQLGHARGEVLNKGVDVQVALLAFLAAFALSCLATIALARLIRGWRLAGDVEQALDPGQA
jgi:hypothetical protein